MSWLDKLEEIRRRDWSQAPSEERDPAAREVVTMAAYAGAAASVVPIPLVDLALLLPIHTAMVMTVGQVFGRPITSAEAKRAVVELGAIVGLTFAGHAGLSALKRLVLPGLGGVVAAPASFAMTWGLGRVAMAYFRNPDAPREELEKIFEEAMKEGRALFSKEALERFKKKHGSPEPSAGQGAGSEAGSAPPRASAETPPPGRGVSGDAAAPEASPGQETTPSGRPRKRTL